MAELGRSGYGEDERGQMLIMIVGFGLACLLLITMVIDTSQVFLYRRALNGAADGAALAASDALDTGSVYDGGAGKIELSPELAAQEIEDYARETTYPERFNCELGNLTESRVTAHCFGTAILPFVNRVSGGKGTIHVTADASAETFAN